MNNFNTITKRIEALAKQYPSKYELSYTMPYDTEQDIKNAEDLRSELYDSFNSVQVYPNGLHEVRIVASAI